MNPGADQANSTLQFHPLVSVIIKTYDDSEASNRGRDSDASGATLKAYLKKTLDALVEQTLLPDEILIVDSSQGDGIAKVVNVYPRQKDIDIRRIPLASEHFSHPRALNLGVREAKGEIVSSLSGDATPANQTWLENLVKPLSDPLVVGAYSRHLRRPETKLSWAEHLRLWWRYRKQSSFRRKDPIFSNASSAFYRKLALEIPFDERLVELEDYDWSLKIRDKGYTIAYAGDSEVYHSHFLSSARVLKRIFYYAYLRTKLSLLHWAHIKFSK